MENLFKTEIKKELEKNNINNGELITEADIAGLPVAVQRHFQVCGYLGMEKMYNAMVEWEDVEFKRSPDQPWIKLKFHQFNSVAEPMRIILMQYKLLKMVPVEGRDKYQDGQGNSLIKFMKFFTVGDACGPDIDKSSLATVLSECFLLPTYALQPYIKWTGIDDCTAQATIKYKKCQASGIFHFNEQGEFDSFETEDKFFAPNGKSKQKIKWTAQTGGYIEACGVRYPTLFQQTWNTSIGDYMYFSGKIKEINFNISKQDL